MPKQLIDFSVNLNPFGTLPSIKGNWVNWIDIIEDYPDPDGYRLIQAIVAREQICQSHILLGNGGAELITLLANFLTKKRIGIVQPTFIEYEKMCRAFQCDIEHIVLQEGKWHDLSAVYPIIKDIDALFLCHPNNPTGITYNKETLRKLIEQCEQEQCYLIIDEAFYDFAEEFESAVSYVSAHQYVIVIRSLTKMYSIAGLRLGYMMGPKEVISSLKDIQPHWSINSIALEAGIHCLDSEAFVMKTRKYIANERKKMQVALEEMGFNVSKSDVNYLLIRDDTLHNQEPIIRYLLQKGIVPRHTENYRGLNGKWIRVAIKKEKENELLLKALQSWKRRN